MKICIVGASKRFTSGLSYYTIYLSNALAEKVNVSTICFRQMLPTFMFPGKSRVGKDIVNMDFKENINVTNMDYNNPLTWAQVAMNIKKEQPDFIILQWWSASVAHMHLLIKLFSKLTNAKVIIEFHEVVDPFEESITPIRIYAKTAGKLLRNNCSAYITHSESDKRLVAERYAINPEKICVMPFGLFDQYGKSIDCNEAKKSLGIKEDFVILSFGLIRKYKGIPYLIDAFEDLPKDILEKSRLLIVGEIWEDKEAIINQIETSPVRDKITLIDEYIPDDKVNIYFSAANVVVLPYLRASQSGVAHIAMSFGKPIIVSDVGGLSESMKYYDGTFFVPPGKSHYITAGILTVSASNQHYEIPKRSWDIIADQVIKICDEVE